MNGMETQSWRLATGGLLLASALMIGGCETMSDAGAAIKEGVTEMAEAATEFIVGKTVIPTIEAVVEETCVARQVLSDQLGNLENGFAQLGVEAATELAMQAVEANVNNPPVFCGQNVVGTALLADQVITRSLDEMTQGVVVASEALQLRSDNEQQALARIVKLRNASLAEKLDPAFQADIDLQQQYIVETTAKLETEIKENPLTPEAQEKLIEANKHLYTGAYYRGKGMVAVYVLVDKLKNMDEETALDSVKELAALPKPETFFTSMMGSLPKMVSTVGESMVLSKAIHDAIDDDQFEDALEESERPDTEKVAELQSLAEDLKDSTDDLGLPTVEAGA